MHTLTMYNYLYVHETLLTPFAGAVVARGAASDVLQLLLAFGGRSRQVENILYMRKEVASQKRASVKSYESFIVCLMLNGA